MFSQSDIGAKAAWKGFSSQTTYIAFRLINLQEDFDFCPEEVEDLLIKKNGIVREIVQVKNLTSALSLSSLSPDKYDSFFRRCLSYKTLESDVILKIVSFGKIGPEIASFINMNSTGFEQIKSKLIKMEYSLEDIEWLSKNLIIEQVNEDELMDRITEKLLDNIETMASPGIFLDVLTQYIANLSRRSESTTKVLWSNKIRQISMDLAALSGVAREFGNSILPMTEYKQPENTDKLKEEYLAGINAQPQHIRLGVDFSRNYWLEKIDKSFQEEKIVIVKGASGQGKSSLCYRYLYNYYSEKDVFCIQSVTNEEQAQNIAIALNGLSKDQNDIIVYYDISPQDTNWIWVCEKLYEYGSNFKLLLSIREEDFRRSNLDTSKISIEYINLNLSIEEAEIIFNRYENNEFRSFTEAWAAFGGTGPLMEFTYMLSQSQTLKNKLDSQINRILLSDDYIEEWLIALLVISYAGKYSIDVDVEKLFLNIDIRNKSKMIFLFEEEYLVRISENKKTIHTLHALRASLIRDILLDKLFISEIEIIDLVLNSTRSNMFYLLISYFYDNSLDNILLNVLVNVKYDSWEEYSSVLRALLWLELRTFYLRNKHTIFKIEEKLEGDFPIFLLGDVTSFYSEFESEELLNLFREKQPDKYKAIENNFNLLKNAKLEYSFFDEFIEKTYDNLPMSTIDSPTELSAAGYGLFWLGLRGVEVNEAVIEVSADVLNKEEFLEPLLDFIVGLQKQKMSKKYNEFYEVLLKYLKKKYEIVYLEKDGDIFDVFCIINMYDTERSKNQYDNSYIMSIVNSFRRLSIEKKQYNVTLIGDQIIDGLEVPKMKKNIKSTNLPWLWITEINGWLIKQHDYDKLPVNWNIAKENIKTCVNQNVEIIRIFKQTLGYFYKKKNLKILDSNELLPKVKIAYNQLNNNFLYYPKVSVDKFGVNNSRIIVESKESKTSKISESLNYSRCGSKGLKFGQVFSNFRNDMKLFYDNMDSLLLERYYGKDITSQSHLSLVNLLKSIENLDEVTKLYRNEFPMEDELLTKDNYNEFMIFASIWSHLYETDFRFNRSIIYERSEYLKRYKKRIIDFINNKIDKYEGVVEFFIDIEASKDINITVDYFNVECFFERLMLDFKKNFPEIKLYSIENIIWNKAFNSIILDSNILGYYVPPRYKILSQKFSYTDDIKKMMLYSIQMESEEIENPILDSFFKYNNLPNTIHLYATHVCQVNIFLEGKKDSSFYNENVFINWKNNIHKVMKEECFDKIYQAAELVVNEIALHNSNYKQISKITNNLGLLVKKNIEELDSLLNSSDINRWNIMIEEIYSISKELNCMISEDLESFLISSSINIGK